MDILQMLGMGGGGQQPQQQPFAPMKVGAPNMTRPDIGYKPSGFLGGMEYTKREQEYADLQKQQKYLNDLAIQAESQRVKEYLAGATNREASRNFQSDVLRDAAPYGTDLGKTGAQTQVKKNEYETQVKYGPEAVQNELRKYREQESDEQWKNRGRALQVSAEVFNQASEIAKAEGEAAGRAFLEAQLKSYRNMGLGDFLPPDVMYKDPKSWALLSQSARSGLKQYQDLDYKYAELRTRKEVARINANAKTSTGSKAKDEIQRDRDELQKKVLAGTYNYDEIVRYNTYVHQDWLAYKMNLMKQWRQQMPPLNAAMAQMQENEHKRILDQEMENFWLAAYGGRRETARVQLNMVRGGVGSSIDPRLVNLGGSKQGQNSLGLRKVGD